MDTQKDILSLRTRSCEETVALGRALGEGLAGGETIAFAGGLGVGKTQMTGGIAEGLGVDEVVASPTYLIHKTYEGRLRLHHFDFYRLDSEMDLESVGFYDFQAERPAGALAIEWADKFVESLDEPTLWIDIRLGKGETERLIEFKPFGFPADRWDEMREKLEKTLKNETEPK